MHHQNEISCHWLCTMVNKMGCRASARTDKEKPNTVILKNNCHNHGLDAYRIPGPYRPWKHRPSHKKNKKGKKLLPNPMQSSHTNGNDTFASSEPVEAFFSIREIHSGADFANSLIPEIQIKEEPLSDN